MLNYDVLLYYNMIQTTKYRYKFSCPNCNKNWSGNELNTLSKKIAWHWNKEHHKMLRNNYKQIDEEIIGGHHVHKNEYVVEKVPIYLTSFDIIDRLGQEDGYAILTDEKEYCNKCMKILDRNIEDDEDYVCLSCQQNIHVENIQSENYQLNEF